MLEKLLDKYDAGDETICIDRLDIDLHNVDKARWQEAATIQALQKLEAALQKKLAGSLGRALPVAHRDLDALDCYLRTGAMPWWAPFGLRTDPTAWLQSWIADTGGAELSSSVRPLLSSAAARTRLAGELAEESFWKLVTALSGISEVDNWQDEYRHCAQLLKDASLPCEEYCVACRAAVLGACLYMPDARLARAHLAKELLPLLGPHVRRALQAHLDLEADETRRTNVTSREGDDARSAKLDTLLSPDALIFSDVLAEEEAREDETNHYIGDGGLVLLAPFLPAFFAQLGLLKEGLKIKDAGRAVALLQYAAFGMDDYREWRSLLSKILIGQPVHTLIPTGSLVLGEGEREQADDLLAAVIEHWSVLKNTSPDGLRQSFLRRDARLTEKEGAWRLMVQPQAHDVLLQHLPWTISIIRLPWMPTPLFVDWE